MKITQLYTFFAISTIIISGCDGSSVVIHPTTDLSLEQAPPDNNAPLVIGAATGASNQIGTWGEIISWPFVPVSMANLPDGRILTYSGSERTNWPSREQTYSATWDPETGEFEEELMIGHNMFCAGLTSTADGRVLVNGGRNQGNSPWTTLFDHRDNQWHPIDNMASGGRWYPTTLSLGDGRVLTAIGTATNDRNPDIWKAEEGWKVLNGIDFRDMRRNRGFSNWFPLLSLAPDGNIFHYWDTTENHLVTPNGSGLAKQHDSESDLDDHGPGVHLMYDAGKMLITGRNDGSWQPNTDKAFTVDLNGPSPVIQATSPMKHSRTFHQLIPLPTGEVLVVGGNTTSAKFSDSGAILEPEIWNPQSGQWRSVADMAVARPYHSTALIMTDARIIAAGGGYGGGNHLDGQIFTPPYLYAADGSLATRPTVLASNDSAEVGQEFNVTTTGDVTTFSFIRMSATTHAVNTDARFYKPEFEKISDHNWTIKVHQNPNISTPGYWMLFALDAQGVPSVAQVMEITAIDTRLKNLALAGTARQSSTWTDTQLPGISAAAENAIDGNLNGTFANASTTHTLSDAQAWWELDLGRVIAIDSIRLWNRTDECCNTRLSNFHVLVSNTPFNTPNLSATQAQSGVSDFPFIGIAGRQLDMPVSRTGRYIRVQLAGTDHLQLAEVQVFGTRRSNVTNLALAGTASQSSNYGTYTAANAIDGNSVGNSNVPTGISHTRNDREAWWQLDLGESYNLDSVVVWNRTDSNQRRLQDFHLIVSDQPFNSQDLNTTLAQPGVFSKQFADEAPRRTEALIGRTGRYIRVQLPRRDYLHLAEVEVFGESTAVPLEITPITTTPQPSSGSIAYAANATGTGQLQYQWNFGDGSPDTSFSANSSHSHTYAQPGRYVVSVIVRDATGDEKRHTFTQVVHSALTNESPTNSGSLVEIASRNQLWSLNPDNDSVTVTDTNTLAVVREIEVGADPASLALAPDGRVWVTNRESASISVINAATQAVTNTYSLPYASEPYGIVFDDTHAYVALEATGQVIKLAADGTITLTQAVGRHPRHLALDSTQQKLYVSRFITPMLPGEDGASPVIADTTRKYGGEVLIMNPATLVSNDTIILEHSNRAASEHEGPGIPNYVGPVTISPNGNSAWVPSKQDNILAGALRGGAGMVFDQTVRAVTSYIDLNNGAEDISRRIDHDNSSVAGHAAYDPFGATLFVSLEGNRQVAIVDASSGVVLGRLDTGHAPQGVLVSDDGERLYIHNFMDRTVDVYDIADIVSQGASTATHVGTVNTVAAEKLSAQVLRGKQLFYDARDDRLASLDYMSCASCHADGEHDGRVWDFTSLGEGLRNTITLKGRSGMGHGILHWTGNFDEGQDFEGQIRDFAGGTGLMNDADFNRTSAPLGDAKAGLSVDLDALAAYMTSLTKVANSPHRNADGSLTADALIGESLFASNSCGTCHSDAIFTDSPAANLHDIGTIMPDSGKRLGQTLTGFDTPSLLGVWRTAPYLHDGSAATLQQAIASHIDATFNATQLDQLAAYVSQLDQSGENITPPPPVEPPTSNVPHNLVADGAISIDGTLGEWNSLTSFGTDPDDATNGTDPIDWREAWLAHDSTKFYLAYRADETVSNTWGYGVYIDTDSNRATGFTGFANEFPIGADFLIESSDIQRYTGSGANWSWEGVGTAQRGAAGNNAEYAIDRAILGNPTTLQLFMRGDNSAVAGTVVDLYPDNAVTTSAELSNRHHTYTVIASNGNTPPVANNQSISLAAGTSTPVTLTGSDANGDGLTYEVADQPSNGSLSGTAPNLIYTPNTDFVGADSFTFTAKDDSAQSNLATVNVAVQGGTLSNQLSITVDGSLAEWLTARSFGEDPADANGVNDSIDWKTSWAAHDAGNVYFAYRNHNTFTPSWGNAIYIDTDGDRLTGFRGFADQFAIGADYLLENNALLRYTGTGTNWSWAGGDVMPSAVVGTDAEVSVSRTLLGNPRALQLYFRGDNTAVSGSTQDYFPDDAANAAGAVRYFDYAIDSDVLNQPPTARAQTVQTGIDTALSVTLSGTDPEAARLSYTLTRQPQNGAISGSAPSLTYTPSAGFSGTDSFAFTVNDGVQDSQVATVSITVIGAIAPANDISNPVVRVVLDGNLSDWTGQAAYPADPIDVTGTGPLVDWRQAFMSHTVNTLNLAWQVNDPVTELNWGYSAYLDTDKSAATGFTGFAGEFGIGVEYLLEGADLYRYTGTGQNWSWEFVARMQFATTSVVAEISIPRASIGNPSGIEFFLRGDSLATSGVGPIDFYPDAVTDRSAATNSRRLGYDLTTTVP